MHLLPGRRLVISLYEMAMQRLARTTAGAEKLTTERLASARTEMNSIADDVRHARAAKPSPSTEKPAQMTAPGALDPTAALLLEISALADDANEGIRVERRGPPARR
jgi:hypothetical protein